MPYPPRLPTQEADVPATAPPARPIVLLSRRDDDPIPRSPAARALLEQARQGLLDAEYAQDPLNRYAHAQLAALRAAAAVLAVRARPGRRVRPTSAWVLLANVAPELAEWSMFFAAASATRAATEAGVRRLVTTRAADDLIRQVGEFLTLAQHAASRTSR